VTIRLTPETERLLREELSNGHVDSVDELIRSAVDALREKQRGPEVTRKPRESLYELLTTKPFAGSELEIERQKEYPGPIEL
jgi:Arc/MetJ-type ribon-helix-helix transcriptional regulator